MGMATCTQASGISVVFLKVLYAIRLDKQTIKSASRPLLGHLSSCVPSILRCFGSKYGQICKERFRPSTKQPSTEDGSVCRQSYPAQILEYLEALRAAQLTRVILLRNSNCADGKRNAQLSL